MSMSNDMSAPVTRDELREALSPVALKADLEKFATKIDLDTWGGALVARMQSGERRIGGLEQRMGVVEQRLVALEERMDQRFAAVEERMDQRFAAVEERMDQRFGEFEERMTQGFRDAEQRLSIELARHVNAFAEQVSRQIAAVFEPFADLPARVRRLEDIVLGADPPPR